MMLLLLQITYTETKFLVYIFRLDGTFLPLVPLHPKDKEVKKNSNSVNLVLSTPGHDRDRLETKKFTSFSSVPPH